MAPLFHDKSLGLQFRSVFRLAGLHIRVGLNAISNMHPQNISAGSHGDNRCLEGDHVDVKVWKQVSLFPLTYYPHFLLAEQVLLFVTFYSSLRDCPEYGDRQVCQ